MSSKHLRTGHVRSFSRMDGYLDFFQMLSGIGLILFMWSHMFFVATVVISPKLFNFVAWLFEVTYMANIAGVLIATILISHFILAARKMPFKRNEFGEITKHALLINHKDTWKWLIQVVSGMIILVMGLAHVWVVLSAEPMNIGGKELIISATSSAGRVANGWLLYYMVLLLVVEVHIGIGFYRLGVKWGYISRKTRPFWKRIELAVTASFIVLGVAVLYTLLKYSEISGI